MNKIYYNFNKKKIKLEDLPIMFGKKLYFFILINKYIYIYIIIYIYILLPKIYIIKILINIKNEDNSRDYYFQTNKSINSFLKFNINHQKYVFLKF